MQDTHIIDFLDGEGYHVPNTIDTHHRSLTIGRRKNKKIWRAPEGLSYLLLMNVPYLPKTVEGSQGVEFFVFLGTSPSVPQ